MLLDTDGLIIFQFSDYFIPEFLDLDINLLWSMKFKAGLHFSKRRKLEECEHKSRFCRL